MINMINSLLTYFFNVASYFARLDYPTVGTDLFFLSCYRSEFFSKVVNLGGSDTPHTFLPSLKCAPMRPACVGPKASNIIAGFEGNVKTVKF